MKFDRQLRPATETSWVVSCGGKTIPRWGTAAILKIDISPYLSEKSSDFDEILYTAADFELYERHVIKNKKVALDRLRVRQNVFLVINIDSVMRGALCGKLHRPPSQLFAQQQSSIDSQLFVQNRDLCLPHRHSTPPPP